MRFKAVHSTNDIPFARRIGVTWTGLGIPGAIFVGLAGIIYTHQKGIVLDDPETIFMLIVDTLFHPLIAGILLAAILSAIMSTVSSQLLVCSTAFAEDFYRDMFRKDATQQEILLVGRCTVIGLAMLATLLAMDLASSVLGMVSYAWAGFGAAFGPALVLSLYWQRMTVQGALAGIIVGGFTVVFWKHLAGLARIFHKAAV